MREVRLRPGGVINTGPQVGLVLIDVHDIGTPVCRGAVWLSSNKMCIKHDCLIASHTKNEVGFLTGNPIINGEDKRLCIWTRSKGDRLVFFTPSVRETAFGNLLDKYLEDMQSMET